MTLFTVNQRVIRINSGNDNGNTGNIVELDTVKNRARVLWDHSGIRTWIRFACLAPKAN